MKVHKLIILRLWVKSGFNPLSMDLTHVSLVFIYIFSFFNFKTLKFYFNLNLKFLENSKIYLARLVCVIFSNYQTCKDLHNLYDLAQLLVLH